MLVLLPLSVVLFLTRADASLFHCQYLQLAIVRDKRQQRAGERLDSSCLPGGRSHWDVFGLRKQGGILPGEAAYLQRAKMNAE